jgi:hypothetical protein
MEWSVAEVIGSAGWSEHMEERRSAIALVLKKARGVVRKEEERDMGGHLGLTIRIPAGFCVIASSVASVISSRGGKDEVDDCRSSVGRVGCVMASDNEEEETGDSGLVTSFSDTVVAPMAAMASMSSIRSALFSFFTAFPFPSSTTRDCPVLMIGGLPRPSL